MEIGWAALLKEGHVTTHFFLLDLMTDLNRSCIFSAKGLLEEIFKVHFLDLRFVFRAIMMEDISLLLS